MNTPQPIFNPSTHYLIEVGGRVSVEWLKSFERSWRIHLEEIRQVEDITVLTVHTDQSGLVGLLRRLHGLGIPIHHVQIVLDGGAAAEAEEQG